MRNNFNLKKIIFHSQTWQLALIILVLPIFVYSILLFRNSADSKKIDALKNFSVLPKTALANYQFAPTGGTIVNGTATSVNSMAVAAAEGVNLGSWRATLADDNYHWMITSTTTGLDVNLVLGNVQLNGANTLILNTKIDEDANAPQLYIQVCDWVSNVAVDNASDAECTGGGWRTLNNRRATITPTVATAYVYYVYDGYWTTSSTTNDTVATPLTNFVNGTNQLKVRYFSTNNTNTDLAIDYLRAYAVVNPVYAPAGFATITPGTTTGSYMNTNAITAGAIDAVPITVTGTAATSSNFYFKMDNVISYTGANAIVVKSTYSCSATGIGHRPKIYNFSSSSWEWLTASSSIGCAVAYATNAWALSNINVNNYINSSGEMWVGWEATGNSATTQIRIDQIYAQIGTVNTDSSACEISFGTLSAGTCASSTDLDMTATTSNTWNIRTMDESKKTPLASSTFYAYDYDADAVLEEAQAYNIPFSVTPPTNAQVTGLFYASRFAYGSAAGAAAIGLRDYSGLIATNTWQSVGSTTGAALTYIDNITDSSPNNGGALGMFTSPASFIDSSTSTNNMNMRVRTASDSASTTNAIGQMDFAMVSLQWTYDNSHFSENSRFTPVAGTIVVGNATTSDTASTSLAEGVNMGSWRGTLYDDNFHWMVYSLNPGGIDFNLDLGRVQLNNANTLIINTEIDEDATAPQLLVQICDWVSPTSVDAAADTQCTGGGWRTLNNNKTAINISAATAYVWYLYDGFWAAATSSNVVVSTPLDHFVSTSSRIKIRYYSPTNTATAVKIDYLRAQAVVNPVYTAAGFATITAGTVAGGYMSTNNVTQNLTTDNLYLTFTGTAASSADAYLIMKDVRNYTGANAIVVRAEYSCSATGIGHRPKIYNFASSSWEYLTGSTSIACSVTDAINAWSKSPVNVTSYINGSNQMWIGWQGQAPSATTQIRIDQLYAMIGSVNSNPAGCEISFGTASSGTSCDYSDDLDMTGTSTIWGIKAMDESAKMPIASSTFYPYDYDADAVLEEAGAYNIPFSVSVPNNSYPTGLFFAARFMSGTALGTVQAGLRDYSGLNTSTTWLPVGAAITNTLTYTDNITIGGVANGGANSVYMNGEDFIDSVGNTVNMRIRTTTDAASTTNATGQMDFAFVSPQWMGGDSLGSLSADMVSATGSIISQPLIYMNGMSMSNNCQTASGTIGTTTQDIRINNQTSLSSWTVSIAASSTTALWSTTSSQYDFNDSLGSGCSDGPDADNFAGQMTVNPAISVITPQSGCQLTGISKGGSASFNEGVTDALTLISGASTASTNCYWDVSGIGVYQTIPAMQLPNNYSMDLTITIVAN
ncbi:MAG: hypothetical protein WCG01_03500 [bacterium]